MDVFTDEIPNTCIRKAGSGILITSFACDVRKHIVAVSTLLAELCVCLFLNSHSKCLEGICSSQEQEIIVLPNTENELFVLYC